MATLRSEAVTVGPAVVAYPRLAQPSRYKNKPDAKLQYSVQVILTQESYAQLLPTMQELATRAFPNGEYNDADFDWGVRPTAGQPNRFTPEAVQSGMYYANASSSEQFKPQVVDRNHQPVIDMGAIRDGSQVYISLTFYQIEKGIGVGLGPVMYIGDGEALNTGGGVTAQSAFAGVKLPPAAPTAAPVAAAPVPGFAPVPGQ